MDDDILKDDMMGDDAPIDLPEEDDEEAEIPGMADPLAGDADEETESLDALEEEELGMDDEEKYDDEYNQ